MTSSPITLAERAAADLARLSGIEQHDIAITLGSGWKTAADHLGEMVSEINAEAVSGFRASPVAGHTGSLRSFRNASGKHILVIGARTHLYEGHGVEAVVHGVRTAAAAGVTTMILTNGAGGLHDRYEPGQAVILRDHINLTAKSPIEGADFVDLTDLYSSRLRRIAQQVSGGLEEGVYVQMPGPHYETPAEVKMLQSLGGDVVGMSTSLEAIAARQVGLEILGMSLVTNLAAGIQDSPLNHDEVLAAGHDAEARLGPLLASVVSAISEYR